MRVYLDVSCLNRPFDDQRQTRIRLESEAVTLILDRIDAGIWRLLSSEIVQIEVAAMKDRERRGRVQALFAESDDTITLTEEVFRRAAKLVKLGFKADDDMAIYREEVWQRVRAETETLIPERAAIRPMERVPYFD